MKEKLRHGQMNNNYKYLMLANLPYKKCWGKFCRWNERAPDSNSNPYEETKGSGKELQELHR